MRQEPKPDHDENPVALDRLNLSMGTWRAQQLQHQRRSSELNFKMALCVAATALITGCVSTPKWQSDTSPDSEVAVIHRSIDKLAIIYSVDGEGKGWGIVSEIRLPPGQHILAFSANQSFYFLQPTDRQEPRDGSLHHYIKFVGRKGGIYDVRVLKGTPHNLIGDFNVDIVDRSNGQVASEPLGNFYKQPVLKN